MFFSFAVSRDLGNALFWSRSVGMERASSLSFLNFLFRFAVNQALSACAVRNSMIPTKKIVGTFFCFYFANLKQLYISQFADNRWVWQLLLLCSSFLFDHFRHVWASTSKVLWIRFHKRVSPYSSDLGHYHVSLDRECRDQTWYVRRFLHSTQVSLHLKIRFLVLVRFVKSQLHICRHWKISGGLRKLGRWVCVDRVGSTQIRQQGACGGYESQNDSGDGSRHRREHLAGAVLRNRRSEFRHTKHGGACVCVGGQRARSSRRSLRMQSLKSTDPTVDVGIFLGLEWELSGVVFDAKQHVLFFEDVCLAVRCTFVQAGDFNAWKRLSLAVCW